MEIVKDLKQALKESYVVLNTLDSNSLNKIPNNVINFIKENQNTEGGIWNTNIFGKSVEQLIEDGIRNKLNLMGEECQIKLQDTMKKIVNESNGGMVCIII